MSCLRDTWTMIAAVSCLRCVRLGDSFPLIDLGYERGRTEQLRDEVCLMPPAPEGRLAKDSREFRRGVGPDFARSRKGHESAFINHGPTCWYLPGKLRICCRNPQAAMRAYAGRAAHGGHRGSPHSEAGPRTSPSDPIAGADANGADPQCAADGPGRAWPRSLRPHRTSPAGLRRGAGPAERFSRQQ